MGSLAPLVLMGWFGVVFVLYVLFRPRIALLTSFVGGLLFLPVHEIDLPLLPAYGKVLAAAVPCLVCSFIFDARTVQSFRPSVVDFPIALWIFCPFPTSLANDLGAYDGLSAVIEHAMKWGIPYLLGRVYLRDTEALRDAAVAVVVGALAYVPLCIAENLVSPQLHRWVYGFHQHQFLQTFRYGGYRPMVFMNHGLMVAFWMAAGTVCAFWLWTSGAVRRIATLPIGPIVLVLAGTTVLCRSVNGLVVLIGGCGVLLAIRWTRSAAPMGAIMLIAGAYLFVRGTGLWSGDEALNLVRDTMGEERAQSLETRLTNETMLAEKAWERPALGWGRWGRSRILDDDGKDISTVDGRWIINLGQHGILGLAAYSLIFLVAIGRVLQLVPPALWSHPKVAGATVLTSILGMVMLDDLMNAFINPVYWLALGGLCSFRPVQAHPAPDGLVVAHARQPRPVADVALGKGSP